MNKLKGEITALRIIDQFSKVSLAVKNQFFQAIVINVNAINPNLVVGQTVNILFKETDVTLSSAPIESISIENKVPVIVKEIKKGTLLCRVKVAFQNTAINAVVPAEFANNIQVGKSLMMLIRSNELVLME